MSKSAKPRKKKPSVMPAVKERRQMLREQRELSEKVHEALSECRNSFNKLLTEIEPVRPELNEALTNELSQIESRFDKDMASFETETKENDGKVILAVETAYKDDKIDIEKKFAIMQDVITYQEITERVLNYMAQTSDDVGEFITRANEYLATQPTKTQE